MRFLFDENMPRSFARILRQLGYDAIHVSDVGLTSTKDRIIVNHCAVPHFWHFLHERAGASL